MEIDRSCLHFSIVGFPSFDRIIKINKHNEVKIRSRPIVAIIFVSLNYKRKWRIGDYVFYYTQVINKR
jgi:hypothetical protein